MTIFRLYRRYLKHEYNIAAILSIAAVLFAVLFTTGILGPTEDAHDAQQHTQK